MTAVDFSSLAVAAQTHPAGYALHKYWARKPHNVVRAALQACGLQPGDWVVDPFCGSGVPLSVAAALGARCIGVDVNPVAVLLTQVTLDPPDAVDYLRAVSPLVDALQDEFGLQYQYDGCTMRHLVHATVVICGQCKARVSAADAPKRGRTYVCPHCATRLNVNLEHLVATQVLRGVDADGQMREVSAEHPSGKSTLPQGPCDFALPHNPRILAYRGMRTHHLFTPRNFAVLARFAAVVTDLPEALQRAAQLTLTGAVAQCSRLIAYRNDLKTGGPAWTVPGFWVPPLHLETNPLLHLRARIMKMARGLENLRAMAGRGSHHPVHTGDCVTHLAEVVASGRRAAVVFLDPPYGDSVPYLEFSALWNSFLGAVPDAGDDIAVSDRARGDGSWHRYETGLRRCVHGVRQVLRDDGKLIVTFNNKDIRAWQALLGALQSAGLRCTGAFYQHPAVVSAKAQLAYDGSYVGDVYALFEPSQLPADGDPGAAQAEGLVGMLRHNVRAELIGQIFGGTRT